MPQYCDVEYSSGKLVCHLPITTPTGKVRVLRLDQPVATRNSMLCEGDIVEWQISYFADHEELVELGRILELSFHNGLVSEEELRSFLSEVMGNREFFAERYLISIDPSILPEDFYGFKVLKKKVPILQKSIMNAQIWVELRHKQRAVDFQPMLYLRIPIEVVSPKLVGTTARPKQLVAWEPSIPIALETVKAFSIASEKHHTDMIDVLGRILRI